MNETTKATKRVVVDRRWDETHPAKYGAPGGADKMAAVVTVEECCGREYQNETVICNGVIVLAAQYPAGTDYAARRVAKWAK